MQLSSFDLTEIVILARDPNMLLRYTSFTFTVIINRVNERYPIIHQPFNWNVIDLTFKLVVQVAFSLSQMKTEINLPEPPPLIFRQSGSEAQFSISSNLIANIPIIVSIHT